MARDLKDLSLAESAAGMDMGSSGGKPGMREDADEDGTDPKSMFLQMCQAIRDGNDEEAWEAYQACRE
jgi:hypothetical protein